MRGVIAHYKMDDNAASSTVIDITGSHNGTYKDVGGAINTSTGATPAKIASGLDFDGDEYVEITDHVAFSPVLTPFSISGFVNMDVATGFVIASKGVLNTDGEWLFYVDGSDKLTLFLYDESIENCWIGRLYNTAITGYQGSLIHLVATYDGGILSTGIKLYLNGVQVDDVSSTGDTFVAIENLNHAVWIGRYDTTYADGVIDNIMFFNRVLSAREIYRQSHLYRVSRGRSRDRVYSDYGSR